MRNRKWLEMFLVFFGMIWIFLPCLHAEWVIETVDSEGSVGFDCSMALDSNDYPHISYRDLTNRDLKYAQWTGTEWIIETVDTTDNVGEYNSIALDSSGYPHISYKGYNSEVGDYLKYAQWTGTEWSIETVDAENAGGWNSITMDSNGYPHISYYAGSLRYSRWTGTQWSIETVDDSASYTGYNTSIDLDSNEYPHISYYRYIGSEDLGYAKWTGTEWSIQTIDSEGDVGSKTSMKLDSEDYPHISYLDRNNNLLKYAEWTGAEWLIETVDDGVEASNSTSIALDSNDYPHVSYRANADLKYAQWTGTEWSIETVDDSAGLYSSIVLDSNDYPHISYKGYNSEVGDYLKYAQWNSPPEVSNVSTSGSSGDITVTYDLVDGNDDLCNILVEYQGGSVGATWTTATTSGATTDIESGTGKSIIWKSSTDEFNQSASDYRIRITPNDGMENGTAGISDTFSVDNTESNEPTEENGSSGGGGGGGGRGCFIATAAYGTPMAQEVEVLCKLRDEYLLTNTFGKVFVRTYYKISPPIADFIEEHQSLKSLVQVGLKPLIWISRRVVE